MNRVVITGLGAVSALGLDVRAHSEALRAGRCAIGPIANIATEALVTKIAAEVRGFDGSVYFAAGKLALLDRCAQFALVAAGEAIKGSGLVFRDGLGDRSAVVIGVGVGGQVTLDENYYRVYGQGAKRLHPFTIPKLMISAPASHITMEHGITGPSFTVASACASANHAIGIAFHMVRSGSVDVAVTGGTEATITFGTMKGWDALRVMAPDTCRPFSHDRKGMVLGEGAAIAVLETLERAQARGAEILGEILGYGRSSDAGDI
jgi:nodulation protein E